MNNFFTSDCHFGHFNIISYCNRPFKDLEHMNGTLIRKWNERVKPEDTVFHIGDFCFKTGREGGGISAIEYEKKLNGKIVHIKGNHDKNNSTKTIITNIKISYSGRQVKLIHNWEHDNGDCSLVFCGHVHEKWSFNRITCHKMSRQTVDYVNVGVDVRNFMPVKFEEIMKQYHRWSKGGCDGMA